MWFGAFPEQVGPRLILSIESFDYFGTSEYFSGQKKKRRRISIHKTLMVRQSKLSLYANDLVMSMQFIFGDDWNSSSFCTMM